MSHGRPGKPCPHWSAYLLTCEDYDALFADHNHQCAICHITGAETGHGFLCVDHDPVIGRWAVRGLLCSPCNNRMAYDLAESPAGLEYIRNPWYLRRFAQLGLSAEVGTEPAIGTRIRAGRTGWRRTGKGWEATTRLGPQAVMTWQRVNQHCGPHRIQVVGAVG